MRNFGKCTKGLAYGIRVVEFQNCELCERAPYDVAMKQATVYDRNERKCFIVHIDAVREYIFGEIPA